MQYVCSARHPFHTTLITLWHLTVIKTRETDKTAGKNQRNLFSPAIKNDNYVTYAFSGGSLPQLGYLQGQQFRSN